MESSSTSQTGSNHVVEPKRSKDRFELFIMSEAGKPIYSFNKREDTITLMPLCSALMDYAQRTQKEALASMKTSDGLLISFFTRSPLIFIVINEISSSIDPTILVEQVEAQIVSILTHKNLHSVFEERPTFDLTRLLYGSEKFIDAIIGLIVTVPRFDGSKTQSFLAVTSTSNQTIDRVIQGNKTNSMPPSLPHRVSIPVVCMQPSNRDNVQSMINSVVTSNSKNTVFSLLFRITRIPNGKDEMEQSSSVKDQSSNSDNSGSENEDVGLNSLTAMNFQLLTICNHHNRHRLKILDVHIILALIHGSKAQLSSAESIWLPVCLPRFNRDTFLHSYIAFINDGKYCLIMFNIDREEFPICQKSKSSIEEKLGPLVKCLEQ